MIMEFLKELEQPGANGTNGAADDRPAHGRSSSLGPAFRPGQNSTLSETTPLIRSYSTADLEGASMEFAGQGSVAGGTIMGIHNLAIVFPQFIVALVASIIFRVADGEAGDSSPALLDEVFKAKTGVAWVLRFGGLMALVGAVICRQVPPTKTEKVSRLSRRKTILLTRLPDYASPSCRDPRREWRVGHVLIHLHCRSGWIVCVDLIP